MLIAKRVSVSRVVSKLYRLELTDELGEMIRALPLHDLQEIQVGNHIYLADGGIWIGAREHPARVRVWLDNGHMRAMVRAAGIGLDVMESFQTEVEREAFPKAVQFAVRKFLN